MADSYRTIIGFNYYQYEKNTTTPDRYLILDTQENKTVESSANISAQPLQNGDTISDHMYRNPDSFSISGTFSLLGKNWDDDSYNFLNVGDRLTNVQEVFEHIKNNGLLCTIITISENDITSSPGTLAQTAKNRFKIRQNMALERMQWTEFQASMKYSFTFKEIRMVQRQEDYEELSDEEKARYGYPSVTQPKGSSLGTILADTNQLKEIVIKALYENGFIENDFVEYLLVTLSATIIGSTTGYILVATAFALGKIAKTALVGLKGLEFIKALGGVVVTGGVIIKIAAIVLAVIGLAIWGIIERLKKQDKQKKVFSLVNGTAEQELARLDNLLDDIEVRVNKVKTNLIIYQINGNYEQQVLININGYYYTINFRKNSATQNWYAEVLDMEGNPLKTVKRDWPVVTKITDINRNINLWFKDLDLEYEVYLVNPSLNQEINDSETIEQARQNLETYSIWVSKGNIQENISQVTNAIENAIEEEGFM